MNNHYGLFKNRNIPMLVIGLSMLTVPQMASANNQNQRKAKIEAQEQAQQCRPAIRSMSESIQNARRNCPKPRRILM